MSAATATPAKKEEKTGLLATVANNARQYGIVGALLVIVVAFEVLHRRRAAEAELSCP